MLREALRIDVHGTSVVGTYHIPEVTEDDESSEKIKKTGVLIVNFGLLPRSGLGNMPVHFSDRLAEKGFPVFRFDFPGLGDTKGDLPIYGQQQWRRIEAGDHMQWGAVLIQKLMKKYNLDGIVIGGLCGGAVTSTYIAERLSNTVVGTILMEPTYHVIGVAEDHIDKKKSRPGNQTNNWFRRTKEKLKKQLRTRINKSKHVEAFYSIYSRLKVTKFRILGHKPPSDVNELFYTSFKKLNDRNAPILFITRKGKDREHYDLHYTGYSPRFFPQNIVWKTLGNTNHMLVTGGGKQKVTDFIVEWVVNNY